MGEQAYNGGYHVDSDWEEKLRNADIPEKLIERIGYFLKDNEPVYYDDEEEEESYDEYQDKVLDKLGF